jgi:hypothetical protein
MIEGLKTHTACRACGGFLVEVLPLGDQRLNAFPATLEALEAIPTAPLTLAVCTRCSLAQLVHTVPPDLLYRTYWYKSGVNESMVAELQTIVKEACAQVPLGATDHVLDIGANDGTLLAAYRRQPYAPMRAAVEPALNLHAQLARQTDILIKDYFPTKELDPLKGRFKVITAIACAYDLEDPRAFFQQMADLLHPDGIAIIQFQDLLQQMQCTAFDNCFAPTTLVVGEHNRSLGDQQINDLVYGESGRLTPVRHTMRRSYQGDLVEIKAAYLWPVVPTPEHLVKIVPRDQLRFACGQHRPRGQDYGTRWVAAKEVQRGDFLVVPRLPATAQAIELNLGEFNSTDRHNQTGLRTLPLTTDTAWLLGLWVAEGSVSGQTTVSWTLGEHEHTLIANVQRIVGELGRSALVYSRRDNGAAAVEVKWGCCALARALPNWCGRGARNKHVPAFILESSPEIRRAFLRGLFAGDGSVQGNKIQLHTTSSILVQQVQLLVASFGAMMGIAYSAAPPAHRVKKTGSVIKSGDSWHLRGTSPELCELFGVSYVLGRCINRNYIVRDDCILVPVTGVTRRTYTGDVCNIETGDNTYLVSNAVTHNCVHEHLEYYTLSSLLTVVRPVGLDAVKVQTTPINGGSLRVTLRHAKMTLGIQLPSVQAQLNREEAAGLSVADIHRENLCAFDRFRLQIRYLTRQIRATLDAAYACPVDWYGASTKSNCTLQVLGLGPQEIRQAIDRNPEKHSRLTITGIPIVGEEIWREDPAPLTFLGIWQFKDFVLARERDYLKQGGTFLLPMPHATLIKER